MPELKEIFKLILKLMKGALHPILHLSGFLNELLPARTLGRFKLDRHNKPPRLMDRVRTTLRVKRYGPSTEKTYCYWIRYFIRFHGVRHPAGTKAASGKSPINRAPTS